MIERRVHDLLRDLYSYEVSASDYGDFLYTVDDVLTDLALEELSGSQMPERFDFLEALEQHFAIAGRIAENLGAEDEERKVARLMQSGFARLRIGEDRAIAAMTPAAQALFGTIRGRDFSALPISDASLAEMRRALSEPPPSGEAPADRVMIERDEEADRFYVMHLRQFPRARCAVLTCSITMWNDFTRNTLADTFGLSTAELDIARALAEGRSANEIAEARGRALGTVRMQIKSIQQKTGCNSAVRLVRMIAELMSFTSVLEQMPEAGRAEDAGIPERNLDRRSLVTASGRRVTWHAGRGRGRPVLMMHGLLQGVAVTAEFAELARRSDLRLIGPARPGYRGTDPALTRREFEATVIADILAVLERERVERVVVLAHMVGTQYIAALHEVLGPRMGEVVIVSGFVPFDREEDLRQQNGMQRLAAFAARYSPRLLALIAQLGERHLKSGQGRQTLDRLLGRSAADRAALEDPEIEALLIDGLHHLTAQGRAAFTLDCMAGAHSRPAFYDANDVPRHFLHGVQDPAVPASAVEYSAGKFARARLDILADAGQTLLHTHPGTVVAALDAAWQRVADQAPVSSDGSKVSATPFMQ